MIDPVIIIIIVTVTLLRRRIVLNMLSALHSKLYKRSWCRNAFCHLMQTFRNHSLTLIFVTMSTNMNNQIIFSVFVLMILFSYVLTFGEKKFLKGLILGLMLGKKNQQESHHMYAPWVSFVRQINIWKIQTRIFIFCRYSHYRWATISSSH